MRFNQKCMMFFLINALRCITLSAAVPVDIKCYTARPKNIVDQLLLRSVSGGQVKTLAQQQKEYLTENVATNYLLQECFRQPFFSWTTESLCEIFKHPRLMATVTSLIVNGSKDYDGDAMLDLLLSDEGSKMRMFCNLETLTLYYCVYPLSGLALRRLSSLKTLVLYGCSSLTKEGTVSQKSYLSKIPPFVFMLPHLKKLVVDVYDMEPEMQKEVTERLAEKGCAVAWKTNHPLDFIEPLWFYQGILL